MKGIIVKFLHIIIMGIFLFDAYYKVSYLQSEADRVRQKYTLFQEFIERFFGSRLPFENSMITSYSEIIVSTFAAIQAASAIFFILGEIKFGWLLIILTLIQTSFMQNPFYRNATEIDKQRAYRYLYTDLCLIAALFVVLGSSKHKRK